MAPPVVDFTFTNDNTCSGTNIQFTSTLTGTGPFTYSWDFGDGTPLVTTVSANHTFNNAIGCGNQPYSVVLTVTDINNAVTTKTKVVTVKRKVDVGLADVDVFFPFSNCHNNPTAATPNYTLTVNNISTSSSCTTSYTLNWGDATIQNNLQFTDFPLTHTYTQLGSFNLSITANASNGCNNVKTYVVANQSNPAGSLGTLGSTTGLCAPATVPFTITNWELNSPGTTYELDFGDGQSVTLTHPLASSTISHTYLISSCPAPSFTAVLNVINACDTTPYTAGNIQVRIKPKASFTNPPNACISDNVCFTNTTIGGNSGSTCSTLATYVWNFGDPASPTNIINQTSATPIAACHTFSGPGIYMVSLTTNNPCGPDTFTNTICIEGPATPSFTLNSTNGCTPQTITANNTTTVANACTPATYQWTVTYASANCGSGATPPFYAVGSTATSTNPTFNFTTPGNYTISLTATNSCGSVTSASQTVVVKKPPTAIINPINDFCGVGSITPSAAIDGCAPAGTSLTYAWSFPGGLPATANTANPGTIIYNTTGTFTVSLTVSNDCGSSVVSTKAFTINVAPTITNTPLTQAICSGMQTALVVLTATPASATFTWTATATPGVTGFINSGSGNIPIQTITTTAATAGTVTYQITPIAGTCPGTVVSYTIVVNPAPNFTSQPASSAVCQGGTPTALTVALSNAAAPQYQWYSNPSNNTSGGTLIPGATSATYAPPSTAVGTLYYYCVVTLSSGGCANIISNVAQVDITVPVIISLQPTATQNICAGGSIAALTLSYSGGTGTVSYQWFLNNTNSNTGGTAIAGATANAYTPPVFSAAGSFYYYAEVTLTGSNCGTVATTTAEVLVSADPVISAQPIVTQTLCQGVTPTLLTVTATGGVGTLNYQWYSNIANNSTSGTAISGATSNTFSPPVTITGTLYYYCLVSQSAAGCTVVSATAEVIVKASPVITTQPQNQTVCQGGTVPALTVAYTNGVGTPSYQWYSNTANNNTTGIPVTGATAATFIPTAATVGTLYYYCIITLPPSGGCSAIVSNSAEIIITSGISITSQPLPSQDLCVGAAIPIPLTIAFTGGTGTATYQWYSNTTTSNTGGTSLTGETAVTYTPPAFSAAGTFYYYLVLTLSGNGCGAVASDVATINVFADPVISIQPMVTQTLCQSALPAALTVTAAGGVGTFSYQWYSNLSNNNTGGTALTGEISATLTPPTIAVATTYYYCVVSQTGLGCGTTSNTAEVVVIAAPAIVNQPLGSTVCVGGTPDILSVTYANGTGIPAYQWYSNAVDNTSSGTAIAGAGNASYAPPGNTVGTTFYYVIITLASSGGCSAITSQTAAVTATAAATISTQPLPSQSLCVGATIPAALTAAYTGGTGTPSWQWYTNTSLSNTGGTLISGATTDSYTPPAFNATGTFYFYAAVTLTGNGCGAVATDPAVVNVVSDPVITTQPLASQTLCQNATPQTLGVVASGGVTGAAYNYQWYSNTANNNTTGTLITGATSDTYIPNTASTGTIWYYCIVTQPTAQGCETISATAEVLVNLAPAFTMQPLSNTLCLGQSTPPLSVAYANGVGVPQYQWYANAVNNTTSGTLIVGETAAVFNPPVSNIGTTFYYCIVTLPVGGCSAIISDTAEITVDPIAVIAAAAPVICSGNAFIIAPDTIAGNTVPVGTTYTWLTPIVNPPGSVAGFAAEASPQVSISQTLTNTTLNPATVTYIITPLSGICIGADFTITVTVNPSISPGVAVTDSKCYLANNGAIDTNITGGIPFPTGPSYLVSWTGPGGFNASSDDIANLAPGAYTLTVTDAGGCPFTQTYTVTEPAEIIIMTDFEKDVTCFNDADGAVTISVTGGTLPYRYTWLKDTFPFATTEDIANLAPGVYSVSVTDANNCGPATAIFTITEPPLLTVALASQTNVLCYGYATGMIGINVAGGTPIALAPGVFDYTYAWTGPGTFTATTQNLSNVIAGTYNLTVTDAHNCSQNLSVTLTQPAEIVITATTTPITCYGANNASISLAISGGVAPYVTAWSNFATGTYQNNLAAGTYIITVTDATNCPKIINVIIPEAPLFLITPVVKEISCYGAHDASINLNFVGGITPIALTWNDGSTSGTVRNNLGPGTYTVNIVDGTPCTINRTFIIVEPQPLALTANTTNAFDCNDANSGAINLLVSGGIPPFSYAWSNGAVTEDLNNISAGNYQVTVTDARGCIKSETYSISRQPPIVININTETTPDCDAHTVVQRFIAAVSGGIPPYVLSWSSGTINGANNEIMQTTTNGAVVLTVTDSHGCTANHTVNVETPVLGYNTFDTASYAYSTYGIYSVVDPVQFHSDVTGDYIGISWDFGDGTFSTELSPSHGYTNPADYIVTQTVTYPFGCIYIHKISLLVEKGYLLVVPTAFTPNGDSLNDYFRPVTKALKNVRLDIYDTWGSLIYSESGENLKGWDAKIKGFEAENGNYFAKVRAETFYGFIVKEEHPFVLIK
ncbi:PKD domain-containing protein [Flavobacterium noncentrifugens]|uniref:PKD domain-containing protein n=1 Tax=Flavobacterium noncentrifugens TaxID=1128970 RepID=UPI001113ACB8|nr:PKD domain-containing protein [Flavobacterium noncentrifugens]